MAQSNVDKEYDVFILCLEADDKCVEWVENLRMELEPDFRCLVPYRDFEPGKRVFDLILNGVRKSSHTIITLCDSEQCILRKPIFRDLTFSGRSLDTSEQSYTFIKISQFDVTSEFHTQPLLDLTISTTAKHYLSRLRKMLGADPSPAPDSSTTPRDCGSAKVNGGDGDDYVSLDGGSANASGPYIHKSLLSKAHSREHEVLSRKSSRNSEDIAYAHQRRIPDLLKNRQFLDLVRLMDMYRVKNVRKHVLRSLSRVLLEPFEKRNMFDVRDVYPVEQELRTLLEQQNPHDQCEFLWRVYGDVLALSLCANGGHGSHKEGMQILLANETLKNSGNCQSVGVRCGILYAREGLQRLTRGNAVPNHGSRYMRTSELISASFQNDQFDDKRFCKVISSLDFYEYCLLGIQLTAKLVHADVPGKLKRCLFSAFSTFAKKKPKMKTREEKELVAFNIQRCVMLIIEENAFNIDPSLQAPCSCDDLIREILLKVSEKQDTMTRIIHDCLNSLVLHKNESVRRSVSSCFWGKVSTDQFTSIAGRHIEDRLSCFTDFEFNHQLFEKLQTDTAAIVFKCSFGQVKCRATIINVKAETDVVNQNTFFSNINKCSSNCPQLNEVATLIKLQHCPNVIQILAHQSHPLPMFFVVEDMDSTLQDFLLKRRAEGSHVSIDALLLVVCQIIEAVQFCEQNNILIRNVSCSAFNLSSRDDHLTVKLSKLPIAREMVATKDRYEYIDEDEGGLDNLNVLFAAPEILLERRFVSDTWATVCTAYEVLTLGCPPLHQLSLDRNLPIVDILELVMAGYKPIRDQLCIPSVLYQGMLECLEHDVDDRRDLAYFYSKINEFRKTGYKRRSLGFLQDHAAYPRLPQTYLYEPKYRVGVPSGLSMDAVDLPYTNSRSIDMAVKGYFPCKLEELNPASPPKLVTKVGTNEKGNVIWMETLSDDKMSYIDIERLRKLEHCNIAQVVDVTKKNECLNLFYQLHSATTPSLHELAKSHFNNDQSSRIWYQRRLAEVADGCAYLHDQGWIVRILDPKFVYAINMETAVIGRIGHLLPLNELGYDKELKHARVNAKVILEMKRRLPCEALTDGIFSQGSDVYSFAIMAYEIYYLLSIKNIKDFHNLELLPFCDKKAEEIPLFLMQGNTLEQPFHMPDYMYYICKKAWQLERTMRPCFKEIAECLHDNEPWENDLLRDVKPNPLARSQRRGVKQSYMYKGTRQNQAKHKSRMMTMKESPYDQVQRKPEYLRPPHELDESECSASGFYTAHGSPMVLDRFPYNNRHQSNESTYSSSDTHSLSSLAYPISDVDTMSMSSAGSRQSSRVEYAFQQPFPLHHPMSEIPQSSLGEPLYFPISESGSSDISRQSYTSAAMSNKISIQQSSIQELRINGFGGADAIPIYNAGHENSGGEKKKTKGIRKRMGDFFRPKQSTRSNNKRGINLNDDPYSYIHGNNWKVKEEYDVDVYDDDSNIYCDMDNSDIMVRCQDEIYDDVENDKYLEDEIYRDEVVNENINQGSDVTLRTMPTQDNKTPLGEEMYDDISLQAQCNDAISTPQDLAIERNSAAAYSNTNQFARHCYKLNALKNRPRTESEPNELMKVMVRASHRRSMERHNDNARHSFPGCLQSTQYCPMDAGYLKSTHHRQLPGDGQQTNSDYATLNTIKGRSLPPLPSDSSEHPNKNAPNPLQHDTEEYDLPNWPTTEIPPLVSSATPGDQQPDPVYENTREAKDSARSSCDDDTTYLLMNDGKASDEEHVIFTV